MDRCVVTWPTRYTGLLGVARQVSLLRLADPAGNRASRDSLGQDIDIGAGAFAQRPVHRDVFANFRDKFRSDDFEIVFPHTFDGAVVLSEGILESDFVVCSGRD